jgi:hypothetical protein
MMDEDPLRRLCDVRRANYRERDRRLAEAWKAPPKQESSLAILIREPSVPIKRVADVLRAECARRWRLASARHSEVPSPPPVKWSHVPDLMPLRPSIPF